MFFNACFQSIKKSKCFVKYKILNFKFLHLDLFKLGTVRTYG